MQLGFAVHPPVQAYLHHAYASGILSAAGYEGVLANEYLQLELRINDDYSGEPTFFDISPWTDILAFGRGGFCAVREEPFDLNGNCQTDLVNLIHSYVLRRNYVETSVDEFYLRGSTAFGRLHNSHAALIVGTDKATHEFTLVGYDAVGRFARRAVAVAELVQAIRSRAELVARGIVPLRCISVNEGVDAGVDPVRIWDGLSDFIAPKNRFPLAEVERVRKAEGARTFYGISCYAFLVDHLDQCVVRGQKIDTRMTRLVWERARIGVKRVELLVRETGVSSHFLEKFRILAVLYHRAHLAGVDYNLRRKAPRADEGTTELLQAAVEVETQLTEALLAELSPLVRGEGSIRRTPRSEERTPKHFRSESSYHLAVRTAENTKQCK